MLHKLWPQSLFYGLVCIRMGISLFQLSCSNRDENERTASKMPLLSSATNCCGIHRVNCWSILSQECIDASLDCVWSGSIKWMDGCRWWGIRGIMFHTRRWLWFQTLDNSWCSPWGSRRCWESNRRRTNTVMMTIVLDDRQFTSVGFALVRCSNGDCVLVVVVEHFPALTNDQQDVPVANYEYKQRDELSYHEEIYTKTLLRRSGLATVCTPDNLENLWKSR